MTMAVPNKGSLARVEPEGQVMRMWEAIETYHEPKQPLIIIAGRIMVKALAVTGLPKVRLGCGSDCGGRL